MSKDGDTPRRSFLKKAALAAGAAAQTPALQVAAGQPQQAAPAAEPADVAYPRVFRGARLKMIAFPLGGVAAGSISLGGRGQLCDWEIFNRPHQGNRPPYAFPSIWAQAGGAKPVARVLEARILPPYEGSSGLGSNNVPGVPRLDSAEFTGEFPLAHIAFDDAELPVKVALDAFSPFIPHDPEDSGLPVAVLRYTVSNPGPTPATVAIAFAIDNVVHAAVRPRGAAAAPELDPRQNEFRTGAGLRGLLMSNPSLAANDEMAGTFAVCTLDGVEGEVTHWSGWPQGRWWNSPMLFWDEFSAKGELDAETGARNRVGTLCLKRTIPPGASVPFGFLLAWHFPNRTPEWCGWHAPKGYEKTVIGNHYTTRFTDAWNAAEYTAAHLPGLEQRTRRFAAAIRESTLPAPVKDAATANLSTLVSTTCFRTADGEFHGFEGCNDNAGCCHGNCTHVWNYETSTAHLFPSFARSLRKSAFGYPMDDAGAMHFRQALPDGIERSGFAAADGQMGQIIHAYLDWTLSGDIEWLRGIWPRVKKALEFAWVPGGWDADRDGVLEGVQHNTYDIEFFGPNPQCGIYYLGALRAGEEMARAVGDDASASQYRRLFENGRDWIDANLFNGEYYIQKVRGYPLVQIAPSLRSEMGAEDTEHPQYQMGEGCLADQLIGQCLAEVAGLGPLVNPAHARKTLESIYRYNFKQSLAEHDCVQRTYALNDESALVVCEYAGQERPTIPFPYYAEAWTGMEYSTAAQMIYAGLVREGVECVRGVRLRHDGEKRNPWDEPECGHHYARAMSAWSVVLALSGFRYDGTRAALSALPKINAGNFRSFWSNATAWGTFSCARNNNGASFRLRVLAGKLECRSCEIRGGAGSTAASVNGKELTHHVTRNGGNAVFGFTAPLAVEEGGELRLEIRA